MSAFSAALTSVGIDLSDVKLVQSNAVVRPLQAVTVQGGLQLSVSSSLGGGRCTTGFAATRGSERGFLAAGHCAILAQDGAADPNVKISLAGNLFNHGASKWNSTTDLAFFWNSGPTPHLFAEAELAGALDSLAHEEADRRNDPDTVEAVLHPSLTRRPICRG